MKKGYLLLIILIIGMISSCAYLEGRKDQSITTPTHAKQRTPVPASNNLPGPTQPEGSAASRGARVIAPIVN